MQADTAAMRREVSHRFGLEPDEVVVDAKMVEQEGYVMFEVTLPARAFSGDFLAAKEMIEQHIGKPLSMDDMIELQEIMQENQK